MLRSLSRIRQLREEAGLSIIELAVYAGLARGTIERLERAERQSDLASLERTRVDTYQRIAKALDVPLGRVWPALAGR